MTPLLFPLYTHDCVPCFDGAGATVTPSHDAAHTLSFDAWADDWHPQASHNSSTTLKRELHDAEYTAPLKKAKAVKAVKRPAKKTLPFTPDGEKFPLFGVAIAPIALTSPYDAAATRDVSQSIRYRQAGSYTAQAVACLLAIKDAFNNPKDNDLMTIVFAVLCDDPASTDEAVVKVHDILRRHGATKKYIMRKLAFALLQRYVDIAYPDVDKTQRRDIKEEFVRNVLGVSRRDVPKIIEGGITVHGAHCLLEKMLAYRPWQFEIPAVM